MPESRIFVILAGRNITIQPTRRAFRDSVTTQVQLRWLAQGDGVTVGKVDFSVKAPNAPITNLQEDPDRPGEWIGTWNPTKAGVFRYSIQVRQDGVDVGEPVDPEIENDPPTEEEEGGG